MHDWFNDVPPNAFYAGAVRWMSDRGIAAGVTDDLFGPDEPIRWRHFATLLWSYAAGPTSEPSSPLDQSYPRTDYERAVDWMALNEIVPGRAALDLDPAKYVTRAEAIAFLHRLGAVTETASREESAPNDLYPERELITERPPFPDVPDEAWYADALDWASDRGIVWWLPPDPFQPDRVVTRSEAAVYLHLFHQPPTPTSGPSTVTTEPEFTDLEEAGRLADHVEALAAGGVFEGTECAPQGFCPNQEITRHEVAVWLVRIVDGSDPSPADKVPFADVMPDVWWAGHVNRLAELEITRGCATDPPRFCPDQSVTRAQMAALLNRAFGLPAADPAGFVDAEGRYAADIDALYAAGITRGCAVEPMRFCPDQPVTRAQMAAFLSRARALSR